MTRTKQLEEATRVRPSKRAMDCLRNTLEAWDDMADSKEDRLEAGALRILIEMHDKLP